MLIGEEVCNTDNMHNGLKIFATLSLQLQIYVFIIQQRLYLNNGDIFKDGMHDILYGNKSSACKQDMVAGNTFANLVNIKTQINIFMRQCNVLNHSMKLSV